MISLITVCVWKSTIKCDISQKILWNQLFSNFFSKNVTLHCACCGNYGNLLSLIFDKNFVKATILLKKLLKNWFHGKQFRWERISRFSTLCTVHRLLWLTFYGKTFVKSTVISCFHEIYFHRAREWIFLFSHYAFSLWFAWVAQNSN